MTPYPISADIIDPGRYLLHQTKDHWLPILLVVVLVVVVAVLIRRRRKMK